MDYKFVAEMIKEKAAEAKDGVGVVSDEVKEKAEDFEFEEFKDEVSDAVSDEAEKLAEEIAEEVTDAE